MDKTYTKQTIGQSLPQPITDTCDGANTAREMNLHELLNMKRERLERRLVLDGDLLNALLIFKDMLPVGLTEAQERAIKRLMVGTLNNI